MSGARLLLLAFGVLAVVSLLLCSFTGVGSPSNAAAREAAKNKLQSAVQLEIKLSVADSVVQQGGGFARRKQDVGGPAGSVGSGSNNNAPGKQLPLGGTASTANGSAAANGAGSKKGLAVGTQFVRGEVFELRETPSSIRPVERRAKPATEPLSVCILSMDVYGLQNVGGTAIAYWQLAKTLASHEKAGARSINRPFVVKVLALVSSSTCDKLRPLYTKQNIKLDCIDPDQTSEQKWEFANPYLVSGATVLEWLREPADAATKKCDVLHAHEWGGVLAPIIAGRLLPGTWSKQLPDWIAVESHGGHMWSLLTHAPHRPTDLIACEVDYYERSSLENADTVISPTKYMLR